MELANLPTDEVFTGPESALLLAVEAWLRTKLNDNLGKPAGNLVAVLPTGQPTPAAGPWFFAVHLFGAAGATDQADRIDRRISMAVTLSIMTARSPRDRFGNATLTGKKGFLNAIAWVCGERGLHGNNEVMADANARIGDGNEDTYVEQGFSEPLVFERAVQQEQGSDWWYRLGTGNPTAGLSCTMIFHNARYAREIFR